jgi:hypothetical protein
MINRDVSRILKMGLDFINSLPTEIQGPSITTDDCFLEFEWYKSPRHIISAILDPTGRIHWAALINGEDPRGHFDAQGEVSKIFLYYLNKFYIG